MSAQAVQRTALRPQRRRGSGVCMSTGPLRQELGVPPRKAAWAAQMEESALLPPRATLSHRKAQTHNKIQLNGNFHHTSGSLSSAGLVPCCNTGCFSDWRLLRNKRLNHHGCENPIYEAFQVPCTAFHSGLIWLRRQCRISPEA